MTNEQREAIEICKEKIIEPFYDFPNPTSIELKDTDVRAIEMVLSMLQEQQEKMDKKDKQKDFIARKYHIFRCSNARLKESMKVLTKAYSDLWEYIEKEHRDVLNEFLMKEE